MHPLSIQRQLSKPYSPIGSPYLVHQKHTVPPLDIGNRVRTAIAVHNFRIAVFCYAKRGFSVDETDRSQTAVCLFLPRFSLGLNFYYSYASVNSKHQHPRPRATPGQPPGFCTLLLPRCWDLYLMTFPGGWVFAYP